MTHTDAPLRVQSHNGGWQISLRGFHETVAPLSDQDLADLADEGVPGTWTEALARLRPRSDRRLNERAMRAIGARMFQRLITGRVAAALQAQAQKAQTAGAVLRLIVQIVERETDPLLLKLPFELLYQHTFWFRRAHTLGLRRPSDADEGEAKLQPGARAVVAWAAMAGIAPSADELRAHGQRVCELLERARFVASIEENCTAERLQRAVEAGCDLLVIVCHGLEDRDSRGRLVLADDTVTGTRLGEWLYASSQRGKRTQAVLLSVCSSADPNGGSSGMAQHLAGGGLAMAAVGYRTPVRIDDALPFLQAVAEHLAQGKSFEAAACEARREMPAETPDWALPLIFAREHEPPFLGVQPAAPVARGSAIPSLLPPAPRGYFVARETELGALRTALATPGVQVLSAGEGGIGKTEIARVLAHEADLAGQLVLWLEKADLDPVRALVTLIKQAVPDFRAAPDTTTESLRAAMCHALGAERGLLVLDDLASGDCVEQLSPSGGWSVLLTSRNAGLLPGVVAHRVPPLDLATATKLLARLVYDQDALPDDHAEAATRLLEQLGGVPLLIETAAAQLRDGRDYAEVLADLRGGQGSVHGKATTLLHQSLTRVTENDRFTWYVVAALPTAGARARNVAAALGESEAEASRRLLRLRDRSLVRWPADAPRATMHPLARQVACELAQRAGEWERVLEAAGRAVIDETTWCLSAFGSDGGEALRRWHELRAFMNTLSLPQWPGGSAGADAIAEALCDVSWFRSQELPPAAQAQLLEDAFARAHSPLTQARVYQARGSFRSFRDDLDGAEADYARALDLFTAVHSNLGIATVHQARGELRVRRANLEGAESDYARALDLFTSVGSNLGQANVHRARGDLRRYRDDLEGAEADYVRALDLYSSTKSNLGLANVHRVRGELQVRRANLDGAEADYARALDLFTSIEDNLGLANVHHSRGELRVRRDDLDGAEADYARALDLFTSIEDNLGLANVHKARGDLRRFRADLEGAIEAYLQAVPLYQAAQHNLGLSNTLVELASVASMQDDRARTTELLEQAEPLVEASHNAYGRKRIAELRRWLEQPR